eukprot:1182181-Prorocentrum_minimum.AAC.4
MHQSVIQSHAVGGLLRVFLLANLFLLCDTQNCLVGSCHWSSVTSNTAQDLHDVAYASRYVPCLLPLAAPTTHVQSFVHAPIIECRQ